MADKAHMLKKNTPPRKAFLPKSRLPWKHMKIFEKFYYGFNFMLRFIANGFKTTRTVLFYPQRPYNCYMIYKICRLLGYSVINNPKQKFDIAISWEDATFRKSPFLSELARTKVVLNIACDDVSKRNIDSVFRQVFGY